MTSLAAAAVVISRGNSEELARVLKAIEQQSHPLSQVVVVETAASDECVELSKSFGFGVVEVSEGQFGPAIAAGIQALQGDVSWLWVLTSELEPDPEALFHLAKAAEISPSVAIIGPKILDREQSLKIRQLGLTLTPTARPFVLAKGAFDQGQHDATGDTLAVATPGMLVAMGLWSKIGGIEPSTPLLAQDIELCLKARALGFRVIVEPRARVLSSSENLNGASEVRLGSKALKAAKAHVHLATILWPAFLLPLLYLAMPLVVLLLVPVNLIQKRPTRIFGQLGAWLYSWFTLPQRLRARKKVRQLGSIAAFRELFASREELKEQRENRYEEVSEQPATGSGLFASQSIWLALVPLLVGYLLWPQGAIVGSKITPLSSSFAAIWSSTGSDLQQYLDGVLLPSDPFNWFYALISLVWPGSPSAALAWFVFLAPGLAFIGAWLLSSALSGSNSVRNAIALSYSLAAPVLVLQREGGIVELVSFAFLPWTIFLLTKSALSFNLSRAWRWLGLAGLTGAAVAISSPMLFAFLVALSLGLSIAKIRRAGVLIWFFVPGVALLAPWIQHLVLVSTPELLTVGSVAARDPISLYEQAIWWIPLAILALLALTLSIANLRVATPIWLAAVALLFASSYQPVASSEPLLIALWLVLLILIGVGLEALGSKGLLVTIASLVIVPALVSGAVFGLLGERNFSYENDRVMPALVVASADVSDSIRTLQIEVSEQGVVADLIWGDGVHQNDRSLLFEFMRPESELDDLIAQFAGSLLAGNPDGIEQLNQVLGIDFVLLTGDSASAVEARVAMDTLTLLQPAGQTSFGQLWSMAEANSAPVAINENSSSKLIQLTLLAVFALLAIPTAASIRGRKLVGSR